LSICGGIFDLDTKVEELTVLEQNTGIEGFWDDNDSAQTTLKKIRVLQNWIECWDNCHQSAIDLEDMFILAKEENDQEVLDSISLDIETLDGDIKTLELKKNVRW
jgi:peptide chain release factor 2